jgi:chorismate--pyruvate lyase
VSLALRRWLRAPGSLSRRLAACGRFDVHLLSEGVARLWPVERRDMGSASGRHWVREVVLRVDGVPVVWARSVTPFRATCGTWRPVRQLGTRPLAQLLFDDPSVARSALRSEVHRRGATCRRRANAAWRSVGCGAWRSAVVCGRSSVFIRRGTPLRVFEAFAPEGIQALACVGAGRGSALPCDRT